MNPIISLQLLAYSTAESCFLEKMKNPEFKTQ